MVLVTILCERHQRRAYGLDDHVDRLLGLLTAHVKGTVERLGSLRPETDIQEPVRHGEHKAVKYHRHDDDNDPVGYIVPGAGCVAA